MSKIRALIKMCNKRNFDDKALFFTYIATLVIVFSVACIICVKSVLAVYSTGTGANSSVLSFALGCILLGLMTVGMGICYCVMPAVPMMKDKANGNIESMLAASANIKDIWIAKTISLYFISFFTTYPIVVILTLIFKRIFFVNGLIISDAGWLLLSVFLGIPIVYFCLCLLVSLMGLCFSAETGNVVGAIFCSGFTTVLINLCARKTIDTTGPLLFILLIVIAIIFAVIAGIVYSKADKEKIVLSCKAQMTTVKGHKKK